MADVQKQFEKFHATIRTDYEMSENLRNKRDIICERIRKHQEDKGLPGFKKLDQGSYRMKTGVVPDPEGMEYDIDVGLRFLIEPDEYTPKTVRGWVWSAVKDHTNDVKDRGPCIRVTYAGDYHVDLVSYAWSEDSAGREDYHLAHKTNGWRDADPPALLAFVDNGRKRFAGTEDSATKTDQLRRCVRHLRRWYDFQIPGESSGKPVGLAYVLYLLANLNPRTSWDGKPDDRYALEELAWTAYQTSGRLVAKKPTPEYEDMFSKLTDAEMDTLKAHFGTLATNLSKAASETDPVKACKLLRDKAFGKDFPVPEAEESAKKTSRPAVITTSSSA